MAGKGGKLPSTGAFRHVWQKTLPYPPCWTGVARTAPFRRELAKLGTEEQAVFDHTALPGVPFVAALCINSVPETCRTWVVTPHLRAQESVASQLETWGVHNILFVPEKEVALGEEVETRNSPRNG